MIKATVTRELPGLPSLQPLHHILSGAESILARLMRLSSKFGTVLPEEAGEAAAQSGASSAAASAAHSAGQAADAANAQVRRDAPQQQAQQAAIPPQAQHGVPVERWQPTVPVEGWHPAVSAVPQHVSYYGLDSFLRFCQPLWCLLRLYSRCRSRRLPQCLSSVPA